jgi:hypothetical protein
VGKRGYLVKPARWPVVWRPPNSEVRWHRRHLALEVGLVVCRLGSEILSKGSLSIGYAHSSPFS